jgi:hypothetical protein
MYLFTAHLTQQWSIQHKSYWIWIILNAHLIKKTILSLWQQPKRNKWSEAHLSPVVEPVNVFEIIDHCQLIVSIRCFKVVRLRWVPATGGWATVALGFLTSLASAQVRVSEEERKKLIRGNDGHAWKIETRNNNTRIRRARRAAERQARLEADTAGAGPQSETEDKIKERPRRTRTRQPSTRLDPKVWDLN